jgi:glycosyltransferase involved in cell wall biosynthesis
MHGNARSTGEILALQMLWYTYGACRKERKMTADRTSLNGRSLAIYLPDLSGGGAERLQLDLAPLFIAAGLEVTFLLNRAHGALLTQVPAEARVVSLNAPRQLGALMPIVRYLRRERPDILLVHTEHASILAVWARAVACSAARIIVCQHNTMSAQGRRPGWQFRMLPLVSRLFLGWADRIVAVSAGVADDLPASCGIARERVTVIYNGVVGRDFARKCAAPLDHPWFGGDVPVIVAAGRLVAQKDFTTLITAFARVARERDVRLVLLGEGPQRPALQDLAQSLDVAERIDLTGFHENPLPYLREAALVVLSSRYEGFGMVLAEALACGTPVVSTDCPHGPAEILDYGRYGRLTPVGDAAALSEAILATLDAPPSREAMKRRGTTFTTAASAERYLDLFDDVLAVRARVADQS